MDEHSKPKLSWRTKIFYSFGHVLNDVCASMWFSYLLVYLHKVVGFSNVNSGALLLIGQLADAIATPLVGVESDKTRSYSYGRRKVWHLVGVISVTISFPFVFNLCLGCATASETAKFVYYTPFVVVFQFGWAATQVSHLAMIPELTDNVNDRVTLNALRYSATVSSNIIVFLVTWMLLNSETSETESQKLNTADSTAFTYVVVIVMGIGLFFTVLFHVGIKEQRRDCTYEFATRSSKRSASNWSAWFKEPKFYKVGMLYMCVRLAINITQCYMPMYTLETLKLTKEAIAKMPLVVYISGFTSTLISRIINGYLGRKITFFVGLLMMLITSIWMWFLPSHSNQIYGASVTLGLSGSMLLVTVMIMLADLIGKNVETGAFVYGAMSMLDKVSNEVLKLLLQEFSDKNGGDVPWVAEVSRSRKLRYGRVGLGAPPVVSPPALRGRAGASESEKPLAPRVAATKQAERSSGRASVHPGELYYREVMVFVTGGTTLVAFLGLLSLWRWKIGEAGTSGESSVNNTSRKGLLDSSGSFENLTMSWSFLSAPETPNVLYEPAGFSNYGTVDPGTTTSRTSPPVDEFVQ